MPDAKRPDPRRRGPAPRPGKAGGAGRPRSASRREPRAIESREGREAREAAEVRETGAASPDAGQDTVAEAIRKSVAESAEQQSDQRFGSAARRAAILAAVVCVLTLTIAGPVRTYFAQRTEMNQLKTVEAQLRSQIADLEQQKIKLADPVFIAAQARERLGFVMPGEIPYQVQLPPGSAVPTMPGVEPATVDPDQPWYTALWSTIAEKPHGVAPAPAPPAPAPPAPAPPNNAPPPGG